MLCQRSREKNSLKLVSKYSLGEYHHHPIQDLTWFFALRPCFYFPNEPFIKSHHRTLHPPLRKTTHIHRGWSFWLNPFFSWPIHLPEFEESGVWGGNAGERSGDGGMGSGTLPLKMAIHRSLLLFSLVRGWNMILFKLLNLPAQAHTHIPRTEMQVEIWSNLNPNWRRTIFLLYLASSLPFPGESNSHFLVRFHPH